MTDRYVDVNSQSNLHADKNMTSKDFENLGVYGKKRYQKELGTKSNMIFGMQLYFQGK